MDDFGVKIELLISSLEKKRAALETVLNLTENQHAVLSEQITKETSEMFSLMNSTKQDLIDEIIQMDSVFQGIFNGISDGFEEKALPDHRDKVAQMQAIIKQVMELDIKIRSAEQMNKDLTNITRKPKAPAAKQTKNSLLKQYEKNKKQ
ncbi:MAG: hypothetical protein LBU94_01130 [Clostridiales bacterium]|jgi:hypothetical protein|nr:hypothetical protein [Clostridiales bacterium]